MEIQMDAELRQDIKKHVRKTGTTTIGILCNDGIVLAADKRGTYGGSGGVSYIASTDEEKVQQVTNKIVVTTAGVASELQKVIKVVRASIRLKDLRSKKESSVLESANLFATVSYQNIRQFSTIPGITHFLLAGFDDSGFHLFDVNPDGYLQKIEKYAATGSGMIHANPILDSEYKKDINLEEGIELAKKCINASTKRDPASGEGIDIFTITKDEVKQVLAQEIVQEFKDKKAA
jgi:proteasome beta subunit